MIKRVKNAVKNELKIVGAYYEKELQMTNQQKFRIEKVIQKKANKLYVTWKSYDS